MKKFLSIFTLSLLFPAISFAAFNDVTLTTEAVIRVGSYDLNIHGSNSSIESISVDVASFDVTLLPGSSFSVSSAVNAGYSISVSGSTFTSDITCGAVSILTLASPNGTSIVTITPTGICSPTLTITSSTSRKSSGSAARPLLSPQASTAPPNITKTLRQNMTDAEVKILQHYLNIHNFIVATFGPGSLGKETTYFGPKTKAAVITFQKTAGLVPDGIVGPKTRAMF